MTGDWQNKFPSPLSGMFFIRHRYGVWPRKRSHDSFRPLFRGCFLFRLRNWIMRFMALDSFRPLFRGYFYLALTAGMDGYRLTMSFRPLFRGWFLFTEWNGILQCKWNTGFRPLFWGCFLFSLKPRLLSLRFLSINHSRHRRGIWIWLACIYCPV